MVHTFEVLVDIKEFYGEAFRAGTERYEIDADSRSRADGLAKTQARQDHPYATEYDVRVTRLLR